jgi:hypothetical protein
VTSIGRWARLSFRLQRWEVLASIAGTALLATAMLWFAWQLRGIAATDPACADPLAYVPGCEALARRFQGLADWGTVLLQLSWGAPFAMGVLIGVPIVAREVESRTAGMAWTLARSRTRWVLERLAFAVVALVALLGIVVLASGSLVEAIHPNLHFERDFTRYGQHDWLILARGLAALGIGLVVGAAMGRLLPGLLVAAFALALALTGVSLGMDRWNETLAIVVDPYATPEGPPEAQGALGMGGRVELASGELVSYSDIAADVQYGDETGAIYTRYDEAAQRPDPASFVGWERSILVPGSQYPVVLARESGVTLGIGAVAVIGSLIAVRRRRPG